MREEWILIRKRHFVKLEKLHRQQQQELLAFYSARDKHMEELWHIEMDSIDATEISEHLRLKLNYNWRLFEQEYGTDSLDYKRIAARHKAELIYHRQQTMTGYYENAMDLGWSNSEPIT